MDALPSHLVCTLISYISTSKHTIMGTSNYVSLFEVLMYPFFPHFLFIFLLLCLFLFYIILRCNSERYLKNGKNVSLKVLFCFFYFFLLWLCLVYIILQCNREHTYKKCQVTSLIMKTQQISYWYRNKAKKIGSIKKLLMQYLEERESNKEENLILIIWNEVGPIYNYIIVPQAS